MEKFKEFYNKLYRPLNRIGLSPISLVAFIIIGVFPLFSPNEYYTKLGVTCLIWGTLAMGFDFSVGYINVANWGYAGLMGTGAYLSALVNQYFGISPWLGMLLAGIAAALLGLLIALLTMKMDAMFAAILAWFVGIVLQNIIAAVPDITRGTMGLNVTQLFSTPWAKPYFYVMFAICLLTFCVLKMFVDSRYGLSFRGVGTGHRGCKGHWYQPS